MTIDVHVSMLDSRVRVRKAHSARDDAWSKGVGHGTCVVVHKGLHSPESPPVTSLVPLKTAGAPIHECDMVTVSPEGCRSTKDIRGR